MENFWSNSKVSISKCSKDFAVAVKKWSRDVFGNISERKKFLKRIQGIDNLQASRVYNYHFQLHKKPSNDYKQLLDLRKIFGT